MSAAGSPGPPWRQHPPGVWFDDPAPDGITRLVEFGDETAIEVRVWVGDDDGVLEPLDTPSARQVHGQTWQVGTLTTPAGPAWTARRPLGPACVEVRVHDTSGRSPEEITLLLQHAVAGLDLDGIAARLRPVDVPASPDALRPWPLPASHPLRDSHACLRVGPDVRFGVAAIAPPHAALIGPGHPRWNVGGPTALVRLAVYNLMRQAAAGAIPLTACEVDGTTALRFGPHPLATAMMLLPDIGLLAADVVGSGSALTAIALRRDLLLVADDRVLAPADAFLPPVPLPAWNPLDPT